MTGGAFVALVFVLSDLVDWPVSFISQLAYLPLALTQNSDGVQKDKLTQFQNVF
jgi:hypothetical protein